MNFSVDIETDGICAEKILYTVIDTLIYHNGNFKLNLNITELPEPPQADSTADPTVRPFGAAD
jgi:hypothetical protein